MCAIIASSGPRRVHPPAPETFTAGHTAATLALMSILNFKAGSYVVPLFLEIGRGTECYQASIRRRHLAISITVTKFAEKHKSAAEPQPAAENQSAVETQSAEDEIWAAP